MQNKDISTEKLHLIDGQIIANIVFIATVIVSVILLYNQRLILLNEKPLFRKKTSQEISFYTKIIVIIVLSYFLYVGYVNYEDTKENRKFSNDEVENAFIILISNVLILIAALMSLYVIYINYKKGESEFVDVVNPEI